MVPLSAIPLVHAEHGTVALTATTGPTVISMRPSQTVLVFLCMEIPARNDHSVPRICQERANQNCEPVAPMAALSMQRSDVNSGWTTVDHRS